MFYSLFLISIGVYLGQEYQGLPNLKNVMSYVFVYLQKLNNEYEHKKLEERNSTKQLGFFSRLYNSTFNLFTLSSGNNSLNNSNQSNNNFFVNSSSDSPSDSSVNYTNVSDAINEYETVD